jgi:anti-sigma factor RsiW
MGLDKRAESAADARNRYSEPRPAPSGPSVPPRLPHVGDSHDDYNPFNEACNLVQVNLAAYLDGELDEDMWAVVNNHLAGCDRCADVLSEIQETDKQIQREWRDSSPLPSSSQLHAAVDAIMDKLPEAAKASPEFAARRVHARVRWMRFSTGAAGAFVLFALSWGSYKLGFTQGREQRLPAHRSGIQQAGGGSVAHSKSYTPTAESPSTADITSSYTSSALIIRIHL